MANMFAEKLPAAAAKKEPILKGKQQQTKVHIFDFDLLKAFGYIERVINSIFFQKKTLFTSYLRNVK